MKKVFILLLLFGIRVSAEISVDYVRSGSGSSYSNELNTEWYSEYFYDEEKEISNLELALQFNYTGNEYITSLNSSRPDDIVNTKTSAFGAEITGYDIIGFGLQLARTHFNESEARQDSISASLTFKLNKFRFGAAHTYARTQQLTDVIVLGRNYKDDIKITQRSSTYFMAWNFLENWQTSFRYTYSPYDERLDTMYALLTTLVFLERAGPSVAAEISSLNKVIYDLSISYTINDNWLVSAAGGASRDLLPPQGLTRFSSISAEYNFNYSTQNYRIFAGLESSKPDTADERDGSVSVGVGVSF